MSGIHSNPTFSPYAGLNTLPNTVIKPADKGGAIVLWPTSYLDEAHKQLNNTKYYRKVPHNPVPTLVHDITQFFII